MLTGINSDAFKTNFKSRKEIWSSSKVDIIRYHLHKNGHFNVKQLVFMHIVNSRGPNVDPCGTPLSTIWGHF